VSPLSFDGLILSAITRRYVNTDLTKHQGILTPEQGAEVALYTALKAPNSLRGQFVWADKKPIDWNGQPREYF
jgi:hypothetical protein